MPFVIIASPRTGSSHLVTTLGGHPDIFCNGNIFKRKTLPLFWPRSELGRAKKQELMKLRRADPEAFLKTILDHTFGKPIAGFKIFEGQQNDILSKVIADTSFRKLILIRKNALANYSSRLLAKQTHEYSVAANRQPSAKADQPEERPKVAFEAEEFARFHEKFVAYYRGVMDELRARRQDYYVIGYDDINEPRLLSAVLGFVGADTRKTPEVESQFRQLTKQGPSSIVSRFQNKEAVLEFLTRNNLLHWAHEGSTYLDKLDIPDAGGEPGAASIPSSDLALAG
ncbi:MAG TPA: hypothetical protein VHY79_18930 [Rhizomicrobium sp.]|jgi:LPS sulfotransferase NodH|nr:hypothetical protein [Rhizomicrobium sp.]